LAYVALHFAQPGPSINIRFIYSFFQSYTAAAWQVVTNVIAEEIIGQVFFLLIHWEAGHRPVQIVRQGVVC
jgi:hypothetical protein